MNAQELLERNGIRLNSYAPGRHYTTCARCSGNRSRAHQDNKVLGVTIDDDTHARWGCNHCGWTGPEKGSGNGHDRNGGRFEATYDYIEDGEFRFQKVRYPKGHKPSALRTRDSAGEWKWGAQGVHKPLYRVDEIIEAIANGHTILVVEGEKDADTCWRIGLPATCNFDGAAKPGQKPKWRTEYSEVLRGADIVILPDHDDQGYAHAEATCRMSLGIAKRVRRLDLARHWPDCPKGGDVSDWLAAGNIREQLDVLIEQAPDYPHDDAPKLTVVRVDDGESGDDGDSGLALHIDANPELLKQLGLDQHHNEKIIEICWEPSDPEQLIKICWDPNEKLEDKLRITSAANIKMQGLEWLWVDRFALGKIGLIAGMPDMGKGQIAAFLAAAATAAVELPCNEGNATQGNVIWFNAEDDASDTVIPRLVAAGADLNRVHFVNSSLVDGQERTFSLVTDLRLLREAIETIGNVVLVIIDPVSAYLGVGKVDGRSVTDVRGVLTPLKDMVEELHVAVIGIAHFNKKDDVKSALLRVLDSIAWVAAARHIFAVLDDPEDKNNKLFAKAKNNLARDTKALRYGIGVKTVGRDARLGKDIDAPYVVWHPQHVEITANEAMQAGGGSAGARREAEEFLRNRLEAGPAKQSDLVEEAEQEGVCLVTLRRAKKKLGIKSQGEGQDRRRLVLGTTQGDHAPPSEREVIIFLMSGS